MIELDADLVDRDPQDGSRWLDLTESELRYDHFLGDIRFRVGEADFSTHWGWVPVLDFALGICHLLDAIGEHGASAFEFTESESTLRLSRDGNELTVSADYAPGVGTTTILEARAAASRFARSLGARLTGMYPALRHNQNFSGPLEAVGFVLPSRRR